MKDIVAFDFDGVLVDSLDAHRAAYQTAFKNYGKEFPFTSREKFRELYDSAWENNFLGNGFSRAEFKEVLQQYGSYVSYDQVGVFEGIDKLLGTLAASHQLAVVSTTRQETIDRILSRFGLRCHFEIISGSEAHSDKSTRLREVIEKLGGTPERTTMIGDTASDIRAGKQVKTRTVGVSYGWYTHARLLAERPDQIVHSPAEITVYLTSLR